MSIDTPRVKATGPGLRGQTGLGPPLNVLGGEKQGRASTSYPSEAARTDSEP